MLNQCPALPIEIWISILDQIKDKRQLATCRLVCKLWNPFALKAMFSGILVIRAEESFVTKLHHHLVKQPALAVFIKNITLNSFGGESTLLYTELLKLVLTPSLEHIQGSFPDEENDQLLYQMVLSSPNKFSKIKTIPFAPENNLRTQTFYALKESLEHMLLVDRAGNSNLVLSRLHEFNKLNHLELRKYDLGNISTLDSVLSQLRYATKLGLSIGFTQRDYTSKSSDQMKNWLAWNVEIDQRMESITQLSNTQQNYWCNLVEYIVYKYPNLQSLHLTNMALDNDIERISQAIKHIPFLFLEDVTCHRLGHIQTIGCMMKSLSNTIQIDYSPFTELFFDCTCKIEEASRNDKEGKADFQIKLHSDTPHTYIKQLLSSIGSGTSTITNAFIDLVHWRNQDNSQDLLTFHDILKLAPNLQFLEFSDATIEYQELGNEDLVLNNLLHLEIAGAKIDYKVITQLSSIAPNLYRLIISSGLVVGRDEKFAIIMPHSRLSILVFRIKCFEWGHDDDEDEVLERPELQEVVANEEKMENTEDLYLCIKTEQFPVAYYLLKPASQDYATISEQEFELRAAASETALIECKSLSSLSFEMKNFNFAMEFENGVLKNSQEPVKNEGDKRARIDVGTNVIIKDVSTSSAAAADPSSSSTSSAATDAVASTSSSSTAATATTAAAAATQEEPPVRLPEPITVAKGTSSIIQLLKQMEGDNKENSKYIHPVIIGSRAAAYWVPSFRPCDDWDIVATPSQAVELLKDSQTINNLDIKLIKQPLNANVIRRKQLSKDVKQAIACLPKHLYKITAEHKAAHIKWEIEIAANNNDQESTAISSSATHILELCHANQGDASYMNVSLGSSKGSACIVASVSLLEALKSSHIYWPAYFAKHIADLHTLRAALAPLELESSTANIGIFAKKNEPLTPPTRSDEITRFLLARTLEVEAFRGTPGAHINLNMSNQDFLGRDDDLFVTRHIPHDDVHALVAYGAAPIYDELKTDKSKAMVSKELFEKAAYEKQIQCVKEEAMVIALERFLLPKLTLDPASAYRSALLRICTTLTKGWFRQFAVDNFPRLAVCDKDLLPIRDAILTNHPLPSTTKKDPIDLLRKTVTNLEDLHLMKQLDSLTKSVSGSIKLIVIGGDDGSSDDADHAYDDDEDMYRNPRSSDKLETDKSFWIIESGTPGKPGLLVSFYKEFYYNDSDCILNFNHHATLGVQPLTASIDVKHISAFGSARYGDPIRFSSRDFHKVAMAVCANNGGGSWGGGGDVWSTDNIIARSLAKEVDMLDIDGLTEELLMAYLVAVVQPELPSNGDTPLRNMVNKRKANGTIPVSPANHLWFDCWKYHDLLN
ncbi:hypothetical protein MBANPS3_005723 [Mucor bainieri]